MSDQEQPATAYDAWIALLRSQRDALDAAILALERLAATTAGAPIGTPPLGLPPQPTMTTTEAFQFGPLIAERQMPPR